MTGVPDATAGPDTDATLEDRRSLERDLHDGLQPRLLRLCWLAESALAAADPQELLRLVADEAREAYTTLRHAAQRIYPPLLTERGLAVAVEDHALRSPVPVVVDLPSRRWAERTEAAAYFSILEATTNAVKHAGASRLTVQGTQRGGGLVIEVVDDGRGGADPMRGTGIRGMRARVAVLGGTVAVSSPRGSGTRVTLELPCV